MTPQSLAEQISHWQGFYTLVAGASATLVGLLFVSVSLHLDMFTGSHRSETRMAAEQTLTSFSFLLIIGLIFSVPQLDSYSLGIAIEAIGAAGFFRIVMQTFGHIRRDWLSNSQRPHFDAIYLNFFLRRVLFPILAYVALLESGDLLRNGNPNGLFWLMAVVISLMAGALSNTWHLMVNLQHFGFNRQGSPPSSSSMPTPPPGAGH